MYAIREKEYGYTGIRSADRHNGEWWTGWRWSPAADEAMVFDEEEDARHHAEEECRSRDWQVVEID